MISQKTDNIIPIDPPKTKEEKPEEVILNQQEDHSYEEPETENIPKKEESDKKKEDTNKNFEYRDEGEFDDGSDLTATNPKDEYL